MKNFATKLLLCAILAGTSSFDVSGMKRKFQEDKEIKEDNAFINNDKIKNDEIKNESNMSKFIGEQELLSDIKKLSKKTLEETVHYFTLEQEHLFALINMLKNFKLKEITNILQKVYVTNQEVLKNISEKISYEEATKKITITIDKVKKQLMNDRSAMLEIIRNISPKQFIAIIDQLIENAYEKINQFKKDGFEALALIKINIITKILPLKDKIEEKNKVEVNDIISLLRHLNLE